MDQLASLHKPTLRILVVEDNDVDFLILYRHLNKLLEFKKLTRASNRAELNSMLLEDLDLIVADLHLPDISDLELLNSIATAQPTVPCLAMSGTIADLNIKKMPKSVFAMIEKGDFRALEIALDDCQYCAC